MAPGKCRDELGRIHPAPLPGWGISWWWVEQGLPNGFSEADRFKQMGMEERLEAINSYWKAVAAGWWPDIPGEDWVGSNHPWEPDH